MSGRKKFSVAMPWSLSHYILLNGFHPLYRALVDHVPAGVKLNAWDNVKLHRRLDADPAIRAALMSEVFAARLTTNQLSPGSVEGIYRDFFWPPNQVLTTALMGDIEFHHTAPFPSLERPFVFHCESFATVFFPLTRQGSGDFKNHREIRDYYRRIFAHPLCLGIFSHVPETLASLSGFFSDPGIDRKLFSSRIGLSSQSFADPEPAPQTDLSQPKFLFVNSAHQNPANFFLRGGHLVLRFWKEFRTSGRNGLLMLRCARPAAEALAEHGVDTTFLKDETGRSIIWAEDYLANHEMNALMASAHFFLLPGASLHSVSIMQAMTLGAIPVVTDTVGTSVYVTDDENGIVLQGVHAANWHTDPNTGILVDRYARAPRLDAALVDQLACRVVALLDAPDAWQAMRNRAIARARQQFSGPAFSGDFWSAVSGLHERSNQASSPRAAAAEKTARALRDCTVQGDAWARVFASPTQPVRRIFTGRSRVWELGGAIVHAYGDPLVESSEWSVLAQYYDADSPRFTFANSVDELEGKHLSFVVKTTEKADRRLIRHISRVLRPFPELHSYASSVLKKFRRYRRHLAYRYGRIAATVARPAPANADPVAVAQLHVACKGFHGFDIIELDGEFHAILECKEAFDPAKLRSHQYSRVFSGRSLAEVQAAIVASFDADAAAQSTRGPAGH